MEVSGFTIFAYTVAGGMREKSFGLHQRINVAPGASAKEPDFRGNLTKTYKMPGFKYIPLGGVFEPHKWEANRKSCAVESCLVSTDPGFEFSIVESTSSSLGCYFF